ncbi:hypothetical protein BTR22_16715 [Alkalihalophilus pseudofirmus]|uniref:aminoglycoside phosphotransferase family protein n=1 Tax=Alkalihalophilus pseudofirmus TaxID=79885 RepID=UPI0009512197|nr:hypothetical protein BTR22_16715 [Alkalihalophilus pseudofirmus]
MDLQSFFVQSVTHYFKDAGVKWLKNLPFLIKEIETKFNVKMGQPYELSINYVAPARTFEGEEVVVKICLPGLGFESELAALENLKGGGIVQVLGSDAKLGVMILQKVSPGDTLASCESEKEACLIAANVYKELKGSIVKEENNLSLSTAKNREESLQKMIEEHPEGFGPLSRDMLDEALKVFTYLNDSTKKRYVLHGDFHHYNILKGEKGWKAIDPKGLVGEREYDLIQFMLNVLPEAGIEEVLMQRITLFTEQLNLDRRRLLLYGYAHSVLATAWTVDEEGGYNKHFFQTIESFRNMYLAEAGEWLSKK